MLIFEMESENKILISELMSAMESELFTSVVKSSMESGNENSLSEIKTEYKIPTSLMKLDFEIVPSEKKSDNEIVLSGMKSKNGSKNPKYKSEVLSLETLSSGINFDNVGKSQNEISSLEMNSEDEILPSEMIKETTVDGRIQRNRTLKDTKEQNSKRSKGAEL